MLEQVLSYLNNWFIVPGGVHRGTFAIEDGAIVLPFLQEGQYFRVMGSVFNDGLYQYGPTMRLLRDETFHGTIWALAVPDAVVRLSADIAAWDEKYTEASMGPYSSESKADYSYSKAVDAQTGGAVTWESAFRSRLSQWRKAREYGAITNGGSGR